ncbi:MAG: glycine--tRNA ligase subunit alpha [Vicinamibacterales bacterium]
MERRLRPQPSRRPDDGRFGQNPNRLFKHHQMQVILKPSPDEVRQTYLDSLEACAASTRIARHPVRRTTGVGNSGHGASAGRCCSNGLEITQFTYFSRWAAWTCRLSRADTYGLERIAMFLQRVDNVFDLEWAPGVHAAPFGCARRSSSPAMRSTRTPVLSTCRPIRPTIGASSTRPMRSASSCSRRSLVLPALRKHCRKCSAPLQPPGLEAGASG